MTKLLGHVALGLTFSSLGLWRLYNHIKLQFLRPNSSKSLPFYPTSKSKYLELFTLILVCSIFITSELFWGFRKQPLNPINNEEILPLNRLRHFEHATISLTFFTYAAFAVILDRIGSAHQYALTLFLEAIALGQYLLLIHFHSADHLGVESQYHFLLQIILLVSVITTLMAIGWSKSFLVSFVRFSSIFFHGVWLIFIGMMLWTPGFIPKGCFLNVEEEHEVVRCHGEETLHRAKSLVNLQFSWFLIGICVFSVSFYLVLGKIYGQDIGEYSTLIMSRKEDDSDDVELQLKKFEVGKHYST
ncbi:Transmembrane protein like [Melia azedarach]|uniref:Transmembrane protein like n=1 Tax=Melia azedarach TaxID=155640 RepID=A0ACC1YJX2_MELAZ|nr:Transmembrane protein like [Melia azedarach]